MKYGQHVLQALAIVLLLPFTSAAYADKLIAEFNVLYPDYNGHISTSPNCRWEETYNSGQSRKMAYNCLGVAVAEAERGFGPYGPRCNILLTAIAPYSATLTGQYNCTLSITAPTADAIVNNAQACENDNSCNSRREYLENGVEIRVEERVTPHSGEYTIEIPTFGVSHISRPWGGTEEVRVQTFFPAPRDGENNGAYNGCILACGQELSAENQSCQGSGYAHCPEHEVPPMLARYSSCLLACEVYR